MSELILIVGASVRAAAQSAERAGVRPLAIDLFGDRDLRAVAETLRSHDYPHDLAALASQLPRAPWMYTGALENHPEVIDAISESRMLCGNSGDALRMVRDPFVLQDILGSQGLPFASCRASDAAFDSESSAWLVKPRATGCGLGIRTHAAGDSLCATTEFVQEFISGRPISATFLANGAECRLIGCSRQFIGMPSQPVSRFAFCGAATPWPVEANDQQTIEQIGRMLTLTAGLKGLFGCDFVIGDDGPVLIEVNPRYTATVELFERCGGGSLFREHLDACRGLVSRSETRSTRRALKLILFAHRSLAAPDLWTMLRGAQTASNFPVWADIPSVGEKIEAGSPICTMIVDGATWGELLVAASENLKRVSECLPEGTIDPRWLGSELKETVLGDNS